MGTYLRLRLKAPRPIRLGTLQIKTQPEQDDDSDKDMGDTPKAGLAAKRQRHVLDNRHYRERVAGVSSAAGALEIYVTVTPSNRQVEAAIIAAASECTARAIGDALEVYEAERRTADVEAKQARMREAQRRRREEEREALQQAEKRKTGTASVMDTDVEMVSPIPLPELKVEQAAAADRTPRLKLTPQHIKDLERVFEPCTVSMYHTVVAVGVCRCFP